jgi:hypothetical protein
MTLPPWNDCHFPGLVVKLEDLITGNGKQTKSIFNKIRQSGGLHNYLDFTGNIVLSSIMPDKTIAGLSLERHADIVNSLNPDYHITPDGETYLNEKALSVYEIKRMLQWTEYLIDNCPESIPIGLVKGSCVAQIEDHTDRLCDIGLDLFAFHAGDFIFRSNKKSVQQAKLFYSVIRKKVPWLMIYGIGSDKYFRLFFEADCFATQSHFIQAFYGQEIGNSDIISQDNSGSREMILRNLKSLETMMIGYKKDQMKFSYASDRESSINSIIEDNKYSIGGK